MKGKQSSQQLYEEYKNALGFSVQAYRDAERMAGSPLVFLANRMQMMACLTDLWLRVSKGVHNATRHKWKNKNNR